MIPVDFQITCSKVKVKPLFSAHCVVRSISFDPFTWSIPNLVWVCPQWVDDTNWFSGHMFKVQGQTTRSISFDPFTWSIPNLAKRLHPISRWSLFIFRSHVRRSRSNYSFEPSVLSTLYILTPWLLASYRFCFYRE